MAEKTIPIKTVLMPAYYKDFHCIMGACQDNCCDDGWKIEFSKQDYLTVKHAPKSKEMEELVSRGMRRLRERAHDKMYAEFPVAQGGRCAFHTPEGLCQLQLECGAQTLPKVCRVYPRQKIYTPAALECSLTPSCEGVLGLLWDRPEGIDFIEEPLSRQEQKVSHPKSPMESRFAAVQELWIDALQARALPLPRRLLLLGLLAQQLREADWDDEEGLDRFLERWAALVRCPSLVAEELDKMPGNNQMFLSNNLKLAIRVFNTMGPDISSELLYAVTGKTSKKEIDLEHVIVNAGHYQALEERLDQLLGHSDYFMENLMVSIAFMTALPDTRSPDRLWKSYVSLCNLYSFYRFAAVCAMDKEVSRERLFHVLVHVGRSMLHNPNHGVKLQEEFFQNESATLAHMAILVGG